MMITIDFPYPNFEVTLLDVKNYANKFFKAHEVGFLSNLDYLC